LCALLLKAFGEPLQLFLRRNIGRGKRGISMRQTHRIHRSVRQGGALRNPG
jgi:hypothetical protein